MSNVTRFICIIVDGGNVTLYKPDGEKVTIPQNDPRTKPLVNKIVPAIEADGYCDVDVEELTVKSHYAEAEKQLGGLVRFFRAAKNKVAEILAKFSDDDELADVQVGLPPRKPLTPETQPQTKSQAAVAEIMANAHATTEPQFHVAESEDSTVVAVMDDGTIIPGMEMITTQIQALALKLGNAIGVSAFFRRLASVKHAHSVQDLLKFMQKGELPIADDGSILAYKLLRSVVGEPGIFVDCHTGKVRQRLGSHVCMDPALVDHNRSQDCSNGLHVARRDYLHSFGGDVCVLIKLAPEDVIAVPHGDARKLRACGYHIVAVLDANDRNNVKADRPLTNTSLLGDVVAGNHIGIVETVQIMNQKQSSDSVVITPVGEQGEYENVPSGRTAESLDHMPATEEEERTSVDPRELALKPLQQQKLDAMPEAAVPEGDGFFSAEEIHNMGQGNTDTPKGVPGGYADGDAYRQQAEPSTPVVKPVKLNPLGTLLASFEGAADMESKRIAAVALVAFKKATKKSWSSMGVSASVVDAVQQAIVAVPVAAPKPVAVPPVKKVSKAKAPTKQPVAKPVKAKASPLKGMKVAAKPTRNIGPITKVKEPTKAEQIRKLLDSNPTKAKAQQIVDLKKQAKKGWDALGVTATEEKAILDLLK